MRVEEAKPPSPLVSSHSLESAVSKSVQVSLSKAIMAPPSKGRRPQPADPADSREKFTKIRRAYVKQSARRRSGPSKDGFGSLLAGADPDHIIDGQDHDLPIAEAALARDFGNHFKHEVHFNIEREDFQLHLGHQDALALGAL